MAHHHHHHQGKNTEQALRCVLGGLHGWAGAGTVSDFSAMAGAVSPLTAEALRPQFAALWTRLGHFPEALAIMDTIPLGDHASTEKREGPVPVTTPP